MNELRGKGVLVSGASGGLGEGVVQSLLDAGASVAGIARQWRAAPSGLHTLEADLSTEIGAVAAIRAALAKLPRLDAAVHLVGGFGMDGPVHKTRVETWDRMMDLNAKAAFLFLRAAVEPMLSASAGRLVVIGSRAGEDAPAGLAAYAASKAAVHALVRAMAAELKPTGVTVNAILPSTIDTPANRVAMPNANPADWVTPQSIGQLVVSLCSDASADINGALIPIYGRS